MEPEGDEAKQVPLPKEVIVEKIVEKEVIVEKIVEKEVIKEVPVIIEVESVERQE